MSLTSSHILALCGCLLGVGLAGCGMGGSWDGGPCVSNSQCASGEVCFAEGCGDPQHDIVVEVRGNALAGQYARDIVISETEPLGSIQDFDLGGPLQLQCEFLRGLWNVPSSQEAYSGPLRLKAVGKSLTIPGVGRSYEQYVGDALRGLAAMNIGAGEYAVTATPEDVDIPPATQVARIGQNEATPFAHFFFPSIDGALNVAGKLIAYVDTTKVPAEEVAVTQGRVDLEVLDPTTGEALSQRFLVSSGQPGSNGNFSMTVSPKANELSKVAFRASPHVAGDPVPTRVFDITTPIPTPLILTLGRFSRLVSVPGKVTGRDGSPIADAQVVIGGLVPGGGRFLSQLVVTAADGTFSVQTLAGENELSLTVLPPAASRWGIVTRPVRVDPDAISPIDVECGPRVMVRGTVLRADGRVGSGVRIHAAERAADRAGALALNESETTTDDSGAFSLPLDQAIFDLEFSSSDLPRTSRLVTVGSTSEQQLPEVVISNGRRVSGVVIGAQGAEGFAVLRFFRVPPGDGSASTLLGTAVADENGRYSVLLPSR